MSNLDKTQIVDTLPRRNLGIAHQEGASNVETLAKEKFAAISGEEWASVCNHVDKIVEEYMQNEHLIDDIMDSFEFTHSESDDDNYESYEELLSDEENVIARTLNDEEVSD
ncbi:hypothetical protein QE152_g6113 [Popillia japonica]|uniref:Uncharacterized protein n=1 Tax=Popillia japonica TaxID=7064 RepID=A0AAW1MIJ0_POPJA